MRHINEHGIAIIKASEGLFLKPYICAGGKLTIGYGNTSHAAEYDEITEEQAEEFLKEDVGDTEYYLGILTQHIPLTDNQWSALVSFVFNVGSHNFASSTLRSKLIAGDYLGAANEFGKWKYAGDTVLNGLITRRAKERSLFLET